MSADAKVPGLFILVLTYIKPLEEVDRLLADHVAYLHTYFDAGQFLVSGAREPRTGGVILTRGESIAQIRKIIDEDPFRINGVADYQVVAFHPSLFAEGLEKFFVS